MSTWKISSKKLIPNGEHGTLEVLTAVHDRTAGLDAVVVRGIAPDGAELGEVWIDPECAGEVVSSLLAASVPQQRELFDQERT